MESSKEDIKSILTVPTIPTRQEQNHTTHRLGNTDIWYCDYCNVRVDRVL